MVGNLCRQAGRCRQRDNVNSGNNKSCRCLFAFAAGYLTLQDVRESWHLKETALETAAEQRQQQQSERQRQRKRLKQKQKQREEASIKT